MQNSKLSYSIQNNKPLGKDEKIIHNVIMLIAVSTHPYSGIQVVPRKGRKSDTFIMASDPKNKNVAKKHQKFKKEVNKC